MKNSELWLEDVLLTIQKLTKVNMFEFEFDFWFQFFKEG